MKRKCLRKFKRKRQIGFLTSVGIEKSQLITITINAREQHKKCFCSESKYKLIKLNLLGKH